MNDLRIVSDHVWERSPRRCRQQEAELRVPAGRERDGRSVGILADEASGDGCSPSHSRREERRVVGGLGDLEAIDHHRRPAGRRTCHRMGP